MQNIATMESSEFFEIIESPIKKGLIDYIVACLLRSPGGQAHISSLKANLERRFNEYHLEESITRAANNYCSDAFDFKKNNNSELLIRPNPATFRLITYPKAPNLWAIESLNKVTLGYFENRFVFDVWKNPGISEKISLKYKDAAPDEIPLIIARIFKRNPNLIEIANSNKLSFEGAAKELNID